MEEIVRSVARVTDIMGEIESASDEQSRGIEQISLAVTQMDQVTQQNASLVEEAAAAANALEEQASMLSVWGRGTTNSQLRAIASNHWPRIISRSLWVDQHEWFRPGVTIDHHS